MTRILILSTTTGYQLRAFGEAAERLGVRLMFATDRCHRLDDPWRDDAVAVRFHEEDASVQAIVEAAEHRPIDGVIAVGDRPLVLAARVTRALGLPGNTPEAAAASANKKLARERFAAAGLLVPWLIEVAASTAQEVLIERQRFPVVVKPLGLSGSRGVIRADSPAALAAAVARVRALLARADIRARRSGLEDRLLIEGFIEGREYAVEGVLTRGAFQPFAIFDKPDPLDGPFFEETIYVTPSALPPDVQQAVVDHVRRAAAALGLTHGPVHAECRVGERGIFVLEVAGRPIGGLCSRVLRFVSPAGYPSKPVASAFRRKKPATADTTTKSPKQSAEAWLSLEEVLLRHAVGDDVLHHGREPQAAGVMMIPIPARGMLRRVRGVDAARAVPAVEDIRITAKIDQLLEPLPEAGSYLGFIFARAAAPQAVVEALKEAHGALRFEIAPAIDVRPARPS